MFKITLKISDSFSNISAHIAVKVECLDTNQCYIVSANFFYKTPGTSKLNAITKFDSHSSELKDNFQKPIDLYSDVNATLEDFIQYIEDKFSQRCCGCIPSFNMVFNNCSDAANDTLNYFFPAGQNKLSEGVWQTYKCVTFPACLLTAGEVPLFGAPPFIHAPQDIYKKGLMLSLKYGKPKKPLPQSINGPVQQVMR